MDNHSQVKFEIAVDRSMVVDKAASGAAATVVNVNVSCQLDSKGTYNLIPI